MKKHKKVYGNACLKVFFLKKIHSETIQYELERNKHLVDRLLSDITYQSADNLVSATLHFHTKNAESHADFFCFFFRSMA